MGKYTPEQVAESAETNEHPIPLRIRDMLRAYAATLRQQDGRVDGYVRVRECTLQHWRRQMQHASQGRDAAERAKYVHASITAVIGDALPASPTPDKEG